MYFGNYGAARSIYPSANVMLNMVTTLPDKGYAFAQFSTYNKDIYSNEYHPDSQDWIGFDPFMLTCLEIMHSAAGQYDFSNADFLEFYNQIRPYLSSQDVTKESIEDIVNIENDDEYGGVSSTGKKSTSSSSFMDDLEKLLMNFGIVIVGGIIAYAVIIKKVKGT